MAKSTTRKRTALPLLINVAVALLFGWYYLHYQKPPLQKVTSTNTLSGALFLSSLNWDNVFMEVTPSQRPVYQSELAGYRVASNASETCFWKVEGKTLFLKTPHRLPTSKIAYTEERFTLPVPTKEIKLNRIGNALYVICKKEWWVYEGRSPVRRIKMERERYPIRTLKAGDMLCVEPMADGSCFLARWSPGKKTTRLKKIVASWYAFNQEYMACMNIDSYSGNVSLYVYRFDDRIGLLSAQPDYFQIPNRREDAFWEKFALSPDNKIILSSRRRQKAWGNIYYDTQGTNIYVHDITGKLLYKTQTENTLLYGETLL